MMVNTIIEAWYMRHMITNEIVMVYLMTKKHGNWAHPSDDNKIFMGPSNNDGI